MKLRILCMLAVFVSLVSLMAAQNPGSPNASLMPPPLIQFTGAATDEGGASLSGVVNITFSLYKSLQGGEPLWTETQHDVQLDATGHYSVQLGITKPNGVPTSLFTSGEARWLGVQIAEQPEQPRVLLLSVPYALKAGDAATVGGLPPSAFVLANPASLGSESIAAYPAQTAAAENAPPPTSSDVTTSGGTVNHLPLWDTTTDITSSVVSQTVSGSTTEIGVNGTLALPANGAATSSAGKKSRPLTLTASAYNSGTAAAVNQEFQWQAEPAGNDTSTPSGTLNLLFGEGGSPLETGFNIASNGLVTFAAGQTFPGTGDGTITGVTAGTDLTGGGSTGNVTLNLDTTKVPQLNTANTFSGNQTVNANLTAVNLTATNTVAGGIVNATTGFDIAGTPFGFGSVANGNAFVGFAGVSPTAGFDNTGVGLGALQTNSSGNYNTAVGEDALQANTSAEYNTALGAYALQSDNTGFENTAVGAYALQSNTFGGNNTAVGFDALYANTSGEFNTATGLQALFENTTGEFNTAIGTSALELNTTGSSNTATGDGALYNITTGSNNTATGTSALSNNSTGVNNVAMGYNVLYSSLTGSFNVAMGVSALYDATSGSANTAIGNAAGRTADGSSLTGINNTALGTGTKFSTGTLTNASAIGANAEVGESNAMVLGSINGVNGQTVTIKVGIGTTTPDNNLTVNGSADKPGGGSWGTFSDGRLKTVNGTFNSGLSQILQIHPVRYRYKPDNAMGIRDADEHIGVVAQDLQRAIPEAVTENSKGFLLVNNDPIIWAMLNAIKEQQREIRDLKSELRITRRTLQRVKAQVGTARPELVAAK